MALKLLHTSGTPLGEFDGKDSEVLTLLGGEVVTFTAVTSASDAGAADYADGYLYTNTNKTVVTKTIGASSRPYMLADDGTARYGTLFGTVVGGTVGQVVTGGAVLGPHTATGSGKVTCWTTPGLYAVSLDATDQGFALGLQPTNPTLTAGAALYATAQGLLTPTVGNAVSSYVAGRFVEFTTDGGLVKTPNRLVQALNSPTGATGTLAGGLTWAVFHFDPGQ